jgi:hypothetical protein
MSQTSVTDDMAMPTSTSSVSPSFHRHQVASPYDNSTVSDYINVLKQKVEEGKGVDVYEISA